MSATLNALVATVLIVLAGSSVAQEHTFYGLLRTRDLTPFDSLRLDMRPAHAVSISPGTWAVEVDAGYQNTWAMSEQVESYLMELEATGRRDLGGMEAQEILDLAGEGFFLDLESVRIEVTAHYKMTEDLAAYLVGSGIVFGGGFLDSTIENFHESFGFSSFGRPALTRNTANLVYDLGGRQVVRLGEPNGYGFMDPTLGLRYSGLPLPQNWALSMEGAIKIPVDGEREFLSTGHFDYGFQASLQRRSGRHAFYLDAAAVYYGGTAFPVSQERRFIPTVILGYERSVTARTNVNLQAYISESAYSKGQISLGELTGTKYQYTVGLRHRRNQYIFTFGFTENVQNINNTPDVGLQLGVAYVPRIQPGP